MDPIAQRFLVWAAVLFVAAGLFIAVAERASGRPSGRIWTSYAVQFAIVGYLLVPVALGEPWYAAAIVLLTVQTTREMLSVLRARGLSPSAAAAHLAAAGCLGLAWAEQRLWLVVALALLGGALLASVARRGTRRAADVQATLLAILFPGWCLACCLALGQLRDGARLVIFLYAVVELGDCLALLVGRFFGKRLIWPRLSPKKTVAGSVAGLAAAVGAAGLFSFLMPGLSLAGCLVAGAAIGLLGQAADLAASAVKRWAGVKDYGALVPTHGGVLDVYDSFILTAPAWLLAWSWSG